MKRQAIYRQIYTQVEGVENRVVRRQSKVEDRE